MRMCVCCQRRLLVPLVELFPLLGELQLKRYLRYGCVCVCVVMRKRECQCMSQATKKEAAACRGETVETGGPLLVSGGVLVKPETNRISAFENPRKCLSSETLFQ
jgi:hypothetical protein